MTPPARRARLAAAVAIGLAAGAASLALSARHPTTDLDAVWFGARMLARGVDPYPLVRPGGPFDRWGLYHPAPALVALWPVAWLPLAWARAAFVGASSGLLAWALTRGGWFRLWALASASYVASVSLAQWAPLLTAAALVAPLGGLLVAKPTIGLALAVGRWSERRQWEWGTLGGLLLVGVAFVALPGWLPAWRAALTDTGHMIVPVLSPWGGPLLLLAALRWREPGARLLLALACVPQTAGLYDTLPLFLLARTRREALALALCTHAADVAAGLQGPFANDHAWLAAVARTTVPLVYLPCLAMVLLRPNEGAVPAGIATLRDAVERLERGARRRLLARRLRGIADELEEVGVEQVERRGGG